MIEVTIENRDLDIEATGETRTETFQISRNSIFQGNPGEKGEKGDKGDKGDKGNTGDIGPRGLQGNDAKINGFNAIHLEGDDRRINVGPEASDPTRFHIQFDDTGLLTDAPSDNKQYARKNGQWTVVTGGGGGTSDYNDLENKPSINGRELVGDQTGDDLGLYTFPDNGIPESDLDADVQAKLNSRAAATFEYGVSRFEDILAAYNAGKVCELDVDGYKYRLGGIDNSNAAFIGVNYDEIYYGWVYICSSNNTWQTIEANYAPFWYVETKQDIISDLATIRSNAAEGADIAPKVPPQASEANQLADKAFVNSSIQNVAAYYITKDAAGNPFATKAELLAATTFYSGGQVRVPTRNDYLVVLADESKTIAETGENPTTRYIYDNDVWSYQYIVNRSGLTAAQWAVLQSNITAALVEKLSALPDAEDLMALFAGKVDKVTGKGLSTNDYTDAEKTKVANAEQTANKVTSLSALSTNTQYPSAKCVYDLVGNVESLLNALL